MNARFYPVPTWQKQGIQQVNPAELQLLDQDAM